MSRYFTYIFNTFNIILLLIFLNSCGHIKKEYENRNRNIINITNNYTIKDTSNIYKDTTKLNFNDIKTDTVVIIVGSFSNINNAKKYQKSVDYNELFTSIIKIDSYYRVIIDTLDLSNKKDSIKLNLIESKIHVIKYRKHNTKS